MQTGNNTWGDSDVVLSTLVNPAILEVYYVAAVWRRKLTSLQNVNAPSVNNLSKQNVRLPKFNPFFVHVKYTSNMAACNDNYAYLDIKWTCADAQDMFSRFTRADSNRTRLRYVTWLRHRQLRAGNGSRWRHRAAARQARRRVRQLAEAASVSQRIFPSRARGVPTVAAQSSRRLPSTRQSSNQSFIETGVRFSKNLMTNLRS